MQGEEYRSPDRPQQNHNHSQPRGISESDPTRPCTLRHASSPLTCDTIQVQSPLHQRPLPPKSTVEPHPPPLKGRLMRKQIRHRLTIMRPPTRLRQRRRDINRLEPGTTLLLLLMRHRIGNHDPAQLAAVERLDRLAAEDAVRDDGDDLARAVRHDRVGRLDQRAARVRHVVHQDRDPVLHVAHQHHARDFVGPCAFFVD